MIGLGYMRTKVHAVLLAVLLAVANARCVATCVEVSCEIPSGQVQQTEAKLPPCHRHHPDAATEETQQSSEKAPLGPCTHTTFVADVAGAQSHANIAVVSDLVSPPALAIEPALVPQASSAGLYEAVIPSPPLHLQLSTVLRT